MYVSTRSNEKLTASQAILKGLASDGGLFIPESFSKLNLENLKNKSYEEVSKEIFKLFLDDFTEEEIDYCIKSAYNKVNFAEDFVKIKSFDKISFLELYHGPTYAFKDMALTILPFLVEVSKKKNGVKDKSLILVATSGDTGGAALSSFSKNREFDTVVLYPNGGVSEIQEKQMLSFTNDRTKAYAVDGNFDNCQTFVKEVFSRYPKNNGVILSSANSINIGRLIPQVIYYVYAYLKLVENGSIKNKEEFDICVPTGNFGDIFAGYIAKQIGVPIKTLFCASNKNNVLTDFFKTGVYNKNREFFKSNSPAMDILISSNLERLVYLISGRKGERVAELYKNLSNTGKFELSNEEKFALNDFACNFSTEEETENAIGRVFKEYGYLIDPHTAVAYDGYDKSKKTGRYTLIVSTASPYKFPTTVAKSLNIPYGNNEFEIIKDIAKVTSTKIPEGIRLLEFSDKKTVVKTKNEIEDFVNYKNLKVEIVVPCSTSNLGSCFDTAGMALSLHNTFRFESSEKDELFGFDEGSFNLVLATYKKVFEVKNLPYIPVKITQVECQVPLARGLGSSATCIVAGVLGANYMLKNALTKQDILNICTSIEGHPDNVAPAYLGGFVISTIDKDNNVVSIPVEVSKDLKFFVLIPNFELSTEKARSVLPKQIDYKQAVKAVSKAAITSYAFTSGNLELIKDVFDDKLHHPYRFPLIKDGERVKSELEKQGFAVAISGAGSTILAVGYKNMKLNLSESKCGIIWTVKELTPDTFGAKVND